MLDDERKLRRRILLKLASSPATLLPFMAGITAMAGSWALDVRPGVGLFAGLAGVLAAAGTFFTRLLVGGEQAAKDALEEIREEGAKEREAALDELDARLSADGDPRTERALRDLRTFAKTFSDGNVWSRGVNSRSAYDITEGVTHLFDRSVKSLEQSLQLWHTARQMNTPEARKPIVAQRERIIREVGQSIVHLGQIMVELQNLGAAENAPAGLARVRGELERSLAFARSVDEKVQSLDREYDTSGYE